jgi:hypothetical protein
VAMGEERCAQKSMMMEVNDEGDRQFEHRYLIRDKATRTEKK